ncbi:MAG: monooxygenase [Frankiaceae bacterium]
MTTAGPAVVTLHVWGVPLRRVGAALGRMALDRGRLRRAPGVAFAKLLGTGSGRTFTPLDADVRHWAALACWSRYDAAAAFESSAVARRWGALADERLRVTLLPLASRGRWSGAEPFGGAVARRAAAPDGPVAAITRARLAPARAVAFWRATPPVVHDLRAAPGLALSLGIGEAPIGLQGTFSVWESDAALRAFAYGTAAHVGVVRRTGAERWYAEELFARFAVTDATGTYRGRALGQSLSL